ncbi:KPN_02809 family neutral zinc metallopeptidase [Edaphobacter aggregans]|uniref:KPN_02809 family neutral zinc metallopeptidase n=1 Tax=Edaphobacter aggregans TaxID=570835 RepID=UPI00054E404F|nr:neutral zinc metallopeptidase [Edaphobacter aggregans]
MDWTPGEMSRDVEDRRGSSGGGFGFGGGGLGIIGFVFLLIISLITGRNYIGAYLSGGGHVATSTASNRPVTASREEDRSAHLVSYVLDDVQAEWQKLLPEQTGKPYRRAHLVLFRDYTHSGCGVAQSQTGPFYCPADGKVYIDLGFWDELRRLGGSTADFAQAYVIAHELGHHVQNILGIERQMRQLAARDPSQQNPLSVRLELQADCLAGVWGNTAAKRKIIHREDVEEGLKAAAAVGDDHIQKMSRGAVSPESFTHGTSAERQQWFMRGLRSGEVNQCNTFQAAGSF